MSVGKSSANHTKNIILAVFEGIAKKLVEKTGMNGACTEIANAVIDEAKDESDNKLSDWLEKFYENKQLSNQIERIYESEMNALVAGRDTYSEMYSLIDFASSKSETAIFKSDIIISIDEWRKFRTKEKKNPPSISNEEIKTFLDSLYHNIEIKMANDSELQIFWNVLRNTRKSEEIQNTLNELIEQGRSIQDMLDALYRKREFIEDDTDIYFRNYYSPLCIHKGEVENIVTLKDVFVMLDVEIEDETKSLDTAVRDFIKSNAHETMLLLGHGGFGKTSFVSYMAANKYYFCENRPLHIIRLREYSKSSIDNLCDNIADSYKRRNMAKDAVIVFDGLDELCMITGGNGEDKAAKIIDKLVKQFYAYTGTDKRKIIITSRPGFVNQGDTINDIKINFESVKLLQANYVSFDKAKRDEFVEKIEKADTRLTEEDKKAGCEYIRNIKESDTISDIYSSPFILYLICCVQIKDIKIEPSKLGNSWYLFRKIFHDLYMESQYKDRNYDTEMEEKFNRNKEEIYEKTCEFAFEMYKKGLGEDDVIRLDDNDEELEDFKECYALSCYFNKKDDGVIEFSHNYIRDFFICEYILKELNKVIGEEKFTEEKGKEVADWCSENLLYGHLYLENIIIDLIHEQFKTNDDTYKNFNNINEENIHYIFDCFATGALTAITLMNAELYKIGLDNESLIRNVVCNSQYIIEGYLRIRGNENSIKLISEIRVSDAVLRALDITGDNISCIALINNHVENKTYDSKTVFPDYFDPQAHGMLYSIEENELKEKLGNIPPLIRRQMRIEIISNEYGCYYHIWGNTSHKYDPIKNEVIDIEAVCMTPDDIDSVININTICEGETIRFGNYDWTILKTDIETRKMLVITESIVTKLPFNDKDEAVTWENCTLRNWLNNEFIKEFSNPERERIIATDVDGVNDKIFILSKQEYVNYKNILDLRYDTLSRTIRSNNMVSINGFGGLKVTDYAKICPALWLKF